ncbi:hypothetical protein JXA63_01510 [Candidatus Woesebacteria bacterium]|nr:hypothetical protein [Candidatus Woesebacteria bacterium]
MNNIAKFSNNLPSVISTKLAEVTSKGIQSTVIYGPPEVLRPKSPYDFFLDIIRNSPIIAIGITIFIAFGIFLTIKFIVDKIFKK